MRATLLDLTMNEVEDVEDLHEVMLVLLFLFFLFPSLIQSPILSLSSSWVHPCS
jgi:hypothetical protein